MADTLRDTLEAVVDQAEAHPDEPLTPVESAPVETPPEAPEPPAGTTPPAKVSEPVLRTSEGAKIDDVAAAQLAAAQGKPKPAEPAAKAEPVTPAEHVTQRAPASWTDDAKKDWNTLPLGVRQEVLRREKQIDEAMGQSAEARQLMQTMNQMVMPYMPRLQANQIHPLQSIKNLLEADNLLATAPQQTRAAFLAKIIKDYQIDINELDTALAGQVAGRPNAAAGVEEVVQRAIQPLLQPIQTWQRQQAEQVLREQQDAITTVQRMELDPKYEFFQEVRDYMADIVEMHAKRGLAISPDQAYTMAIQTHPEISKVVQERTSQEAARTALTRGSEAAQRARNASVSVGSSNPVGGGAQLNGSMSLRDTIEAAFTSAGGGGRI
jgi:hypothetical protein